MNFIAGLCGLVGFVNFVYNSFQIRSVDIESFKILIATMLVLGITNLCEVLMLKCDIDMAKLK